MKKSVKVFAVIGVIALGIVAWFAMGYGLDELYYSSDMTDTFECFVFGIGTLGEIELAVRMLKAMFRKETKKKVQNGKEAA